MARATISGPWGEPREIDRELIIGREGADLLVADPQVSRRHAAVRPVTDGAQVEDLGSGNGTFVNGQPIRIITVTGPATVRVGDTTLQLDVEIAAGQATVIRGIPPEGAQPTVIRRAPSADEPQRQAPEPVTRVSAGAPQAPGAPGGPGAGGPSAGGPGPDGPGGPGGPALEDDRSRLATLIVGGLLVAVVVAVAAVILIGSGSNSETSDSNAAIVIAKPGKPNPSCAKKFPTMIDDGFPEPPMLFSQGGVLAVDLTAAVYRPEGAAESEVGYAYNNASPSQTLVICRGDQLNITVNNQLPLPNNTNLHVHGLHVDPDADNVFVDIPRKSSFSYQYEIPDNQSPGMFWYHPHLHPLVSPQVQGGMLGGIIVQGGLDDVMPDVPQRTVVISGGKNVPPPGVEVDLPPDTRPPPNPGTARLLVNGAFQPTAKIQPGELQRWRVLNGTANRLFRIGMPGVKFFLLAQDGYALEEMVPRTELLLSAGQRVELLVQGPEAGSYSLEASDFQPCFRACTNPFAAIPPEGRPLPGGELVKIESYGARVDDKPPTGPLNDLEDLRGEPINTRRTVVMSRPAPPPGQQGGPPAGPPEFVLDKKLFDAERTDITMKLGAVEEWTITNPATPASDEWHNFHLHTNAFQLTKVNGKPVKSVQWTDTVNIEPGGSVTFLVKPEDFTGRAVFHCHIIFHEDNGMMGVLQILENPTPEQVNARPVIHLTPHNPDDTPATLAAAAGSTASGIQLLCRRLGIAA